MHLLAAMMTRAVAAGAGPKRAQSSDAPAPAPEAGEGSAFREVLDQVRRKSMKPDGRPGGPARPVHPERERGAEAPESGPAAGSETAEEGGPAAARDGGAAALVTHAVQQSPSPDASAAAAGEPEGAAHAARVGLRPAEAPHLAPRGEAERPNAQGQSPHGSMQEAAEHATSSGATHRSVAGGEGGLPGAPQLGAQQAETTSRAAGPQAGAAGRAERGRRGTVGDAAARRAAEAGRTAASTLEGHSAASLRHGIAGPNGESRPHGRFEGFAAPEPGRTGGGRLAVRAARTGAARTQATVVAVLQQGDAAAAEPNAVGIRLTLPLRTAASGRIPAARDLQPQARRVETAPILAPEDAETANAVATLPGGGAADAPASEEQLPVTAAGSAQPGALTDAAPLRENAGGVGETPGRGEGEQAARDAAGTRTEHSAAAYNAPQSGTLDGGPASARPGGSPLDAPRHGGGHAEDVAGPARDSALTEESAGAGEPGRFAARPEGVPEEVSPGAARAAAGGARSLASETHVKFVDEAVDNMDDRPLQDVRDAEAAAARAARRPDGREAAQEGADNGLSSGQRTLEPPERLGAERPPHEADGPHGAFAAALRRTADAGPIAPETPEAAAPRMPADPEALAGVVRGAVLQAEEGGHSLRVELHPPELGRLHIRVTVEHGVVSANIVAESGATGQLIEQYLPQLRQALAAQGLDVGRLSVAVGSGGGSLAHGFGTQGQDGGAPAPRNAVRGAAPYEGASAPAVLSGSDGAGLVNILA